MGKRCLSVAPHGAASRRSLRRRSRRLESWADTRAAGYPERPVKIVAPFAPAGPTDIMARILATHLGEALDGTVVIENKPGAGGNIGIGIAAHAEPGRHVPGVSRTCENAVGDRRAAIGRPV